MCTGKGHNMGRLDYFIELFGTLPTPGPGDNASTGKAFIGRGGVVSARTPLQVSLFRLGFALAASTISNPMTVTSQHVDAVCQAR